MPERSFALEAGGRKRLFVSWIGHFEDVDVRLDGQQIATADGEAAMRAGLSANLPDGSALMVRWGRRWGWPELAVLRDGRPVPGSDTDPLRMVQMAGQFAWFLAGATALLSMWHLAFGWELLAMPGLGWPSLVEAGLWAGLARQVGAARRWALIVAIALYALDTVAGLVLAIDQHPSSAGGTLAVRLFWSMFWVRGWWGMRALRDRGMGGG